MKYILCLAFVALCYSYPTGGRNININEDGTIVIMGANGKRISIAKAIGNSGHKNIEIEISGPNTPSKRIQINDQNEFRDVNRQDSYENTDTEENLRDKRSSKDSKKRGFQGDVLGDIMREYQGPVDEKTFDKLLKRMNTAVQAGDLNSSVYEILRNLEQNQNIVGQENPEGRISQYQNTMEDFMQRQEFERELRQLQQAQQEAEWQRGNNWYTNSFTDNSWQQRLHPFGPTYTTPFRGTQRTMGGNTGFGKVNFNFPEQMYQQTYPYFYQTNPYGSSRSCIGNGRTSSLCLQQQRMSPFQMNQISSGTRQTVPEQIVDILDGEREIIQQQKQLQQQQFEQQQQLQEQQNGQQQQQRIQQQQLFQQQQQEMQQQWRQQLQEQQRNSAQQQYGSQPYQQDQQQLNQFMKYLVPTRSNTMQQYGGWNRGYGNNGVPTAQYITRFVPMYAQ